MQACSVELFGALVNSIIEHSALDFIFKVVLAQMKAPAALERRREIHTAWRTLRASLRS
jgi:hypothetical protein